MAATGCVRSPFEQRAAQRRRLFATRAAWECGDDARGAYAMRATC